MNKSSWTKWFSVVICYLVRLLEGMVVAILNFIEEGKKFALKQIAASITIKQNYIYLTRNKFPKLELVIAFQVTPKKERWLCLLSGININILYVISLINISYLIFKIIFIDML